MEQFSHILKYKFKIFFKTNLNLKASSLLKSIAVFFVYAGFAVGVFFFTKSVLKYLIEDIGIGTFLLHRFISILLFIFFISVNLGNIVVSYSTLYRSNEVDFLFTKPLAHTKIFIIKFFDNFFYSSTTLLLFVLAGLAGYGVYFKLGIDFYLITIFLLLLPFMFLAGLLGVIFLFLLIKSADRFGARKVIFTTGLFYIGGLILFFKLNNPINLVTGVMEHYPNVEQYFGFLDSEIIKFLPNFWVAESLYWISRDRASFTIPFILFQLGSSFFFFIIAVTLSSKWYFKTKASSISFNIKGKRKAIKERYFSFTSKSIISPQIEVLLKREFYTFFREPSQWIHLSIMLLLILIFISSIGGIDKNFLVYYNPQLKTIIYLTIFLFNVFLIAALCLRFVFPLISLEGKTFWKVKSSPVSLTKVLLVKTVVYLFFIIMISEVLNFFAHNIFEYELKYYSSINILFISIFIFSVTFLTGGIFANYKEVNPIRIASSQGASITFLIIILYLVFLLAFMYLPVFNLLKGIESNNYNLNLVNLLNGVLAAILLAASIITNRKVLRKDFK